MRASRARAEFVVRRTKRADPRRRRAGLGVFRASGTARVAARGIDRARWEDLGQAALTTYADGLADTG
jgi:hypothetical protein